MMLQCWLQVLATGILSLDNPLLKPNKKGKWQPYWIFAAAMAIDNFHLFIKTGRLDLSVTHSCTNNSPSNSLSIRYSMVPKLLSKASKIETTNTTWTPERAKQQRTLCDMKWQYFMRILAYYYAEQPKTAAIFSESFRVNATLENI